MSKFKVGDRIKRVADPMLGLPIGYETEVYTVNGDQITYWNSAGLRGMSHESNWELVKPASPLSPVRTVTRKEIVEGEFGGVAVSVYDDTRVKVSLSRHILNAADLREAARIFLELADALEA